MYIIHIETWIYVRALASSNRSRYVNSSNYKNENGSVTLAKPTFALDPWLYLIGLFYRVPWLTWKMLPRHVCEFCVHQYVVLQVFLVSNKMLAIEFVACFQNMWKANHVRKPISPKHLTHCCLGMQTPPGSSHTPE